MRRLASFLVCTLLPAAAAAQGAQRTGSDSVFTRAQRLVVAGNGTDGRAIVDSVLEAAPYGSAEHAEALYWRAALAETAAEAERNYLRLTIEYPLSPRTDAALFRLGQLELTRGNRQLARSRFERIALEFPESPLRGRTQLALARIHLEERRAPEACSAVQEARAAAAPGDVELDNQLTYLERQCRVVNAAAAAAPAADTVVADTVAAGTTAADTVAADTTHEVERAAMLDSSGVSVRDSAPVPMLPTVPARDTVRPPAERPSMPPSPHAEPAIPRPASPGFSVQIAAFDRQAAAAELAAELRAQGWEARVDRDAKWHRVRIGHYATRAEASALAKRLQAEGVTGFVTGVPER